MGSAARFTALLAVGVVIMVIYVRSGESVAVLLLCLVTFVAALALWISQPWANGTEAGVGRRAPGRTQRSERFEPEQRWDDTWRCGHDITWDDQGIRGVAVGDRLPGMTIWSRVDRITVGRSRATTDNRSEARRRGIHLELYQGQLDQLASTDRSEVWLCLGPDQDPERVAADLASAWRRAMTERGDTDAPTRLPIRPTHRGPKPPTGR